MWIFFRAGLTFKETKLLDQKHQYCASIYLIFRQYKYLYIETCIISRRRPAQMTGENMSRLRNIPGSREIIAMSDFVVHDPEKQKGRWKEIFGSDAPIEIEIGMGKGRFLMDMAARHPEKNFIGIEMQSSVMFRAIQKAEVRAMRIQAGSAGPSDPGSGQTGKNADDFQVLPAGVTEGRPSIWEGCNFRFILTDARLLGDIFGSGEVNAIYLNFSDPWPKERHGNRRLTSANFLRLYQQFLKPGGTLTFKTDNQDLFDFSLEESEREGWRLEAVTRDLHADAKLCAGNVMTEYEEKFSAKGNPICMMKALAP